MTTTRPGSEVYISVKLTSDEEIKKLNKKFRKKDKVTDVLSFEIKEKMEDGTFYLGDVVVNKDQAMRQCKEYKNDFEHEVSDLVAHGVLHLLGIHHKGDEH